ncbi:MAG: patatin-like phospholipase family protein [Geminicoccaceae bacterium]
MVSIALALQGGGSHGAFTWGVLDRLLAEPAIAIEGVSGTSAGAMNACALAAGLVDGPDAAAGELAGLWRAINHAGKAVSNPFQSQPWQDVFRYWNIDDTPMSAWFDLMTPFASPYQMNPFDHDPLGDLVARQFDYDRLRNEAVPVWLCATNVRTNKVKLFSGAELSPQALLASACLPQLRRAVPIHTDEGLEHFWDGGFVGNPVLKPLIRDLPVGDIVIIQVNPVNREDLPISARDIEDRVNEITFNASMMRELDGIATISRLIDEGCLSHPRYRSIRLHASGADVEMAKLGLKSKFDTSWPFLSFLFELGRDTADTWMADQGQMIGQQSTLDIDRYRIQ